MEAGAQESVSSEAGEGDSSAVVDLTLVQKLFGDLRPVMMGIRNQLREIIPELRTSGGKRLPAKTRSRFLQMEEPAELFERIKPYLSMEKIFFEEKEDIERYRQLFQQLFRGSAKQKAVPEGEKSAERDIPSHKQEALGLMMRHQKRIRAIAIQFWNSLGAYTKGHFGHEGVDDLYNAGLLGFFESARKYNPESMDSHIAMHLRQAHRRMIDCVREHSTEGRRQAWFRKDTTALESQHGPENVTPALYAKKKGISLRLAERRFRKFFGKPRILNFSSLGRYDDDREFLEGYEEGERIHEMSAEEILCARENEKERRKIFEMKCEEIRENLDPREREIFDQLLSGERAVELYERHEISEPRMSQLKTHILLAVAESLDITVEEAGQIFGREKKGFDDALLALLEEHDSPISIDAIIEQLAAQDFLAYLPSSQKRKHIFSGISRLREQGYDV